MSEEEMRARIIELEENEKVLNEKITTLETEKTELETKYNTDNEMNEKRINDLKEYNRELFLKVTSKVNQDTETNDNESDNKYSIDDLLTDLNK